MPEKSNVNLVDYSCITNHKRKKKGTGLLASQNMNFEGAELLRIYY
jgi:hypothetical protein